MTSTKTRPADTKPLITRQVESTETQAELDAIVAAESVLVDPVEIARLRTLGETAKSLPPALASAERRAELLTMRAGVEDGRQLHNAIERCGYPFNQWKRDGVLTPKLGDVHLRIRNQTAELRTAFIDGDAIGRLDRRLMECAPPGVVSQYKKLRAIAGFSNGIQSQDKNTSAIANALTLWANRHAGDLEKKLLTAPWSELVKAPLSINLDDLDV